MRCDDERALWLSRHVLPHEPALRSWLQKRRVVGLEIDDIIQETYGRLSTAGRVDHIRDARTYTFQTAQSVIATYVRRSKIVSIQAVGDLGGLDIASDYPDPEACVADKNELQRLGEAIALLPNRVREVFVLRRVEGLAQRQVAERLRLSESTVEKHMSKALQLLSVSFGNGGNAPGYASRYRREGLERTHGERDASGD